VVNTVSNAAVNFASRSRSRNRSPSARWSRLMLAGGAYTAYASCNRTCEIGMTRATGHDYRGILELVWEAVR
jgi:hypothetical protein